ncbi:SDR family oxidoreductase [Pedobacter sp. L105]|uniref:SDR family oxidoreductase n=1 Tax=Pedobacter sp. L105 TaxID=1641871 RepID=UPI00131D31B0|nr:SDR family oxidoreductase [Pedobacter sp. L105]
MGREKKVWYVTGASKGLGLYLVKQLLAEGYNVAATSRNKEDLENELGTGCASFLPLVVDIRDENSVKQSVEAAVEHFGTIDTVVNNAGYGLIGSLEELSDEESRANFEVNVFGMLNVIRNTMPYLRKQGSGHIINISSTHGFSGGIPGFGVFCATKFAVVGLSESLSAEVRDFGVNVTVALPGHFRTNFLSAGSLGVPENQIPEYAEVRASQKAHQERINGNQPGDPEKAVAALIAISTMESPPLTLFLGKDAYDAADKRMLSIQNEMDRCEELAMATEFAQ